jgi:DNA polymerase-3 subunit alpha
MDFIGSRWYNRKTNMKFTHLHNHSHYSLLDGLSKLDSLVDRVKEFGMDSVALTDHGTMYGIIDFYKTALEANIKPIIGVEAYVAPHKLTDKRPRIDDKPFHLLLLAYNYEGYQNLMRLTSIAHLEGYYYKPRVDKELLAKYSKGIIASTACLGGEIQRSINSNDKPETTIQKIREYQKIFGENNFFLETQFHPEIPEQVKVNKELFSLSKSLGVPIIATCDSHYLQRDEQEAQDIMICVQTGKTVKDTKRLDMRDFLSYLKTPEEMMGEYLEHPEALSNTQLIADRCAVEIPLYKAHFPCFEVASGRTADDELKHQALEALNNQFKIDFNKTDLAGEEKERLDRVYHELNIIITKGYSTYFLIVSDFVNWMRKEGIVTTTRGSAAGCFVSYLIGITNIDPIKYKIPFERFLNPFRPSLPDIDIDIADNRRGEVIDYVRQKYGEDKVAQICTFGTMAARGSVKDTGRALDLPYAFCDELSKLIPMGKQGFPMTIKLALTEVPELKARYDNDPQVKRLFDLAQKIEGCARHASVHAAGVVVSPTPLTDYTPLQLDKDGTIITQYDMYAVGEDGVGLVKMDFLGIRNLSILGEAIKYVKRIHNVDIDIEKISLEDPKTFELLSSGRTMGVFQLSGEGMTQNLVALKPTTIHDIMAMVALYRPGPMESIPEYIKRKHNPELIKYPHQKLIKYLDKSLGLLVYQDDVLYTAIELASYNWEEADKFRKAMGKKIPELMMQQEKKFIDGCVKNDIPKQKAVEIFELIRPFASYGFNKAHAASYGLVAYQTAYLKAHYPSAYMAALMTAESSDLDKVADAINECTEMNIKVMLPDINESFSTFTVVRESLNDKQQRIRFGLVAIKNIGENIIKAIVNEREENGKFKNLSDFLFRVQNKDLNKKSVESLIKSGALDGLGRRDQLLGNLEKILDYVKEAHSQGKNGQVSLFATIYKAEAPKLILEPMLEIEGKQLLLWEKELLGLYVSKHPFAEYHAHVKDFTIPIGKLLQYKNSTNDLIVAGIITSVKKIMTKKNEPMLFVKIEDQTGDNEIVVFPKLYKKNPLIWQEDAVVIVSGKISNRDTETKILANEIYKIELDKIDVIKKLLNKDKKSDTPAIQDLSNYGTENISQKPEQKLVVKISSLTNPNTQNDLKKIMVEHPGKSKVVFIIQQGEKSRTIETSFSVTITSELQEKLKTLDGVDEAKII